MLRKIVQPPLEVGGVVAVVVGFASVSSALGWISAGVASLVFAWRLA